MKGVSDVIGRASLLRGVATRLQLGTILWGAWFVVFGGNPSAGAAGLEIGLYRNGQLVEKFAPPGGALATVENPPAIARSTNTTALARKLGAGGGLPAISAETQARNAAFYRARRLAADVRDSLRQAEVALPRERGLQLERLRQLWNELRAEEQQVRGELRKTEEGIRRLKLPAEIASRHEQTIATFDRDWGQLNAAMRDALSDRAEGIAAALSVIDQFASREAKPATPSQTKLQPAPAMNREAADALLTANTLSAATAAPTTNDLAETPEVQLTAAIRAKAAALTNSPLAIYEFVRNNVEFQPYLGARKGADETLRQLRGNDTDQASLLIALLRAAGFPARYARGAVEMTPARAMSWLGVEDALTTGGILFTAGLEGLNITSNSMVIAVRCRLVWVEAYVPYANYRGVPNENTGPTWVTLVPCFKESTVTSGQDVLAATNMNLNMANFLASYVSNSALTNVSPIEHLEAQIQSWLDTNQPGATVADVERRLTLAPENLGFLPGSLPFTGLSTPTSFSELEDTKRYKVRFHIYSGSTNLIDYTTNLSYFIGKRVTIEYVGATETDQAAIDSYGGIYETPYGAVNVKPVLQFNDVMAATSAGSIAIGSSLSSDMEFIQPSGAPNGKPVVSNTTPPTARDLQAIGFDAFLDQRDPLFFGSSVSSNIIKTFLSASAADYLSRAARGEEKVGRLLRAVSLQDVSAAIVTLHWTGLIVDGVRSIQTQVPVDANNAKLIPYALLNGYDGSFMEHRVFEAMFEQEAVSTIRAFHVSVAQGLSLCYITNSVASACPGFSHEGAVTSAVDDALAKGHVVIIPSRRINYRRWRGTGYIDLNPVTGSALYMIYGGIEGNIVISGGATVVGESWATNLTCEVTNVTCDVTTPGADSPHTNALFCADDTNTDPLRFEVMWHLTCTDGTMVEQPWNFETSKTIKEIIADPTLGPGDYTLDVSIFGELGIQVTKCTRKITLVKLEVEIYKPKVIDTAESMIAKEDKLTKGSMTFVNLDNDDNDGTFDGDDTEVAGGDDELVKLRVKLKPNTLAGGNFALAASAGDMYIKIWKQNDKATASSYTPATLLTIPTDMQTDGDFLIKDFWIEGISNHTAARATTLKAEFSAGSRKCKDEAALTIVGIEKIEWVGRSNSVNDDNTLDADPNWPAGLAPGSQRVFPDSRMEGSSPGSPRDQVDVKVTLSVAPIETVSLYFKPFDVDDPTAAAAPVDDDTAAGSAADNRGTSPGLAGKIVGASGDGIYKQDFDAKEKTFQFQTTMQPGDNFRIVGNGDKDFLDNLENDETTLGPNNDDKQRIVDRNATGTAAQKEIRQADEYASMVLTVWRFLHVEKDSMRAPTPDENLLNTKFTNFVGTTAAATELLGSTTTLRDQSDDLDSATPRNGRFQNGSLVLGSGANTISINSLTGNGETRAVFAPAAIVPLDFTAADNDFVFGSTMSGTVSTITKTGGNFVYSLNITAHSENPIDWPDFVGGTIAVGGGDSVTITAVDSTNLTVTSASLSIAAELRDDDSAAQLPAVGNISLLMTALTPAYVSALDDEGGIAGHNTQDADLLLNLPGDFAGTAANEVSFKRDTAGSDSYWVVYLLMAYQYWDKEDNDPNNEAAAQGVAFALTDNTIVARGGRGSQVFCETIRDVLLNSGAAPDPLLRTTAHEIGHQMGLAHLDTGTNLMVTSTFSVPNAAATFLPAHLHLLRSRQKTPGE